MVLLSDHATVIALERKNKNPIVGQWEAPDVLFTEEIALVIPQAQTGYINISFITITHMCKRPRLPEISKDWIR